MGTYIETGSRFGKADWLAENHGAVRLQRAPTMWTDEVAIICVVHNGDFEAAAYCDTPADMTAFSHPDDTRPKDWLIMDRGKFKALREHRGFK